MNVMSMSNNFSDSTKSSDSYPELEWSLELKTGLFTFNNDLIYQFLNIEKEERRSIPLLQHLSKSHARLIQKTMKKVLLSGSCARHCVTFSGQGCALFFAEVTICRRANEGLHGTVRPLLVESSVKKLANVFQTLFDNPYHGILIADQNTRILACNSCFAKRSGYRQEELIGQTTKIFNANKLSVEFYKKMWRSVEQYGAWAGTILTKRADGSVFPQEINLQRILDDDGSAIYFAISQDMTTELDRVAEKMDGGVELLTQLPDQSSFEYRLCRLYDDAPSSMSRIVLAMRPSFDSEQEITQKIKLSDVLSHIKALDACGYLTEGIFAVSIEYPVSNESGRLAPLQRAFKVLFCEIKLKGGHALHQCIVKGKLGVSMLGLDCDNPKRAVSHAVQAMLENHSGGNSTISFYHKTIHDEIERRKRLEGVLRHSIDHDEIDVHYQPIVETKSWQIVKVEALCRFKSNGETFSTQEMINLAEELGVVSQVDSTVSRMAMQAIGTIKAELGLEVGITINRSLNTDFSAIKVLQDAQKQITEYVDNPKDVTVELTENAYFDNEVAHSRILAALRESGVKIAIDDFGTGYSSMNYFTNCQFDLLKIDRQFVQDIREGATKYTVVKMLVDLAHHLGVQVIAEGAESPEEVLVLRSLDVDFIQGYFFSKPVPLSDLANMQKEQSKRAYALNVRANVSSESSSQKDLYSLRSESSYRLDPSEPLSLAYQYLNIEPQATIPVLDGTKCVGVVTQTLINLHLTASMGTDLETTKEAALWHKPMNQIMSPSFATMPSSTSIDSIAEFVTEGNIPPWVLLDDNENYQGVIEPESLFRWLTE